jgi:pullulanase
VFMELLRIRRDSPLLRLRTAEEVIARLSFHDTGPDGTPGVIVMELRDDLDPSATLDAASERMLIVFNASPDRARVVVPALAGRPFLVHAVQAAGVDGERLRGAFVATASGMINVPALSTVVFVSPRPRR